MGINVEILEEFKDSKSQILAVTKYFDVETTDKYTQELDTYRKFIYGYGENRLESLQGKNIPREKCHFIGNIQSKKISDIVKHCSTIHSISCEKHLLKLKKVVEEENIGVEVFLQLNLDLEKKIGFSDSELQFILQSNNLNSDYFKIIGISGMGVGIFTEAEKREEFQRLIDIRNRYFVGGLISAGTSRDYKIALNMEIDVIRIGNALFE